MATKSVRFRLKAEGTSLSLLSLLVACGGSQPHIDYTITQVTERPDTLRVTASVRSGEPLDGVSLRFTLPDQATNRVTITRSDSLEPSLRKETHSGGVVLTYTDSAFTKGATSGGLTFTTSVGQALTGGNHGTRGPAYGLATATHVAINTDHVLPLLRGRATPVTFTMTLRPAVGDVRTLSGTLTAGMSPSEFWYSGFPSERFLPPRRQVRILRHSVSDMSDDTRVSTLISSALRFAPSDLTMFHLFVYPGVSGQTIYPTGTLDRRLADIRPVTPDRALRLSEQIMRTHLSPYFNGSDEAWLAPAIARYFALHDTEAVGLLDRNAYLYDLAHMYARTQRLHTPLSLFVQEPPVFKEYLTHYNGVLALEALTEALAQHGNTLETEVVAHIKHRSYLSFRTRLALRTGYRQVRRFWNEYITAPVMPVTPASALRVDSSEEERVSSQHGQTFRLALTEGLDGGIELCGCKRSQQGGHPRRATVLKEERRRGALVVDLGGSLRSSPLAVPDAVARAEASHMTSLLGVAGFSAIALSPSELPYLADMEKAGLPIVSTNVQHTKRLPVIRLGALRLAVLGWTDPPSPRTYASALEELLAKVNYQRSVHSLVDRAQRREPGTDGYMLIGYLHPISLARLLSSSATANMKLVLTRGQRDDGEVVERWASIGGVPVAFINSGSFAVTTLTGQGTAGGITLDRIVETKLSESVPDDAATRRASEDFFASPHFNAAVAADTPADVAASVSGLRRSGVGTFVGTDRCKACHIEEYSHWKASAHGTAFGTLLRTRRSRHPGCVMCHVTGFDQLGGYTMRSPLAAMENVGCESCHGPGDAHVLKPQKMNIHRAPNQATCEGCHNDDHSAFNTDPDGYYSRARHSKR